MQSLRSFLFHLLGASHQQSIEKIMKKCNENNDDVDDKIKTEEDDDEEDEDDGDDGGGGEGENSYEYDDVSVYDVFKALVRENEFSFLLNTHTGLCE